MVLDRRMPTENKTFAVNFSVKFYIYQYLTKTFLENNILIFMQEIICLSTGGL